MSLMFRRCPLSRIEVEAHAEIGAHRNRHAVFRARLQANRRLAQMLYRCLVESLIAAARAQANAGHAAGRIDTDIQHDDSRFFHPDRLRRI